MSFLSPGFIFLFAAFLLIGGLFSFRGRGFLSILLLFNIVFLLLRGWQHFVVITVDLTYCWLVATHSKRLTQRGLYNYFLALKIVLFFICKTWIFSALMIESPVGYSFLFLITLAFLIEVRQKDFICLNIKTWLTSALLFPLQSSGPIINILSTARTLSEINKPYDHANLFSGLFLISLGLLKKTIAEIANFITLGNTIADQLSPTIMAWAELVGFAAKYYADFSGYSDIAIGLCLMFGLKVKKNFDLPFLANSFSEFWRKWHSSFNLWLKRYVFEPVCFSEYWARLNNFPKLKFLRKTRVYVAIITSTVFAGLWHGLSMNFFLWGLFIAMIICLETLFDYHGTSSKIFNRLFCFFLILHSFLFYKTSDLMLLKSELSSLYSFRLGADFSAGLGYFFVAWFVLLLPHFLDFIFSKYDYTTLKRQVLFLVIICFLGIHFYFLGYSGAGFVYFRF